MNELTPKPYRIPAVMAQLSVSRATIYRMVAAGKLRLIKIGARSSGITAESIETLLNGAHPR
jgi:excisionase family DNA binding protein